MIKNVFGSLAIATLLASLVFVVAVAPTKPAQATLAHTTLNHQSLPVEATLAHTTLNRQSVDNPTIGSAGEDAAA